jgi:hypothetical protein
MVGHFPDVKASGRTWVHQTGAHVICRLVENSSGGTLAKGVAVTYEAGELLKKVDSETGAAGVVDGFVDPFIPDANVPDGEHFLMIIGGRCTAALAAAETFAVGDLVKSDASGLMTACATKTTAGYCGVVLVATTTNSDPVEILVDLQESVNQGNQF